MSFRQRSKYGVRTDAAGKLARTVDGILFASQREAKRYGELKMLQKAGSIRGLTLQPNFLLTLPTSLKSWVVLGRYRADFQYEELTETGGRWDRVVEDVKGVSTALYKWKKKHVEAQYGIQITEV